MSEVVNAVIRSAILDIGDRGFLNSWINLDYGGTGQGFGGYVLCPDSTSSFYPGNANYAGVWIMRVLQIAGADRWDRLPGKTIRVRLDKPFGSILAIGHIVKDDWFNPGEEFRKLSAKEEAT